MTQIRLVENLELHHFQFEAGEQYRTGVQPAVRRVADDDEWFEPVFYRQGALDGACALSSLLMVLVLEDHLREAQIENVHKHSTKLGRAVRDLPERVDVLLTKGTSAADLRKFLGNLIPDLRLVRIPGEPESRELASNIIERLRKGQPVLVNLPDHVCVGVGCEQRNEPRVERIYLLDPDGELVRGCYWNAYLERANFSGPLRYMYNCPDYSDPNWTITHGFVVGS